MGLKVGKEIEKTDDEVGAISNDFPLPAASKRLASRPVPPFAFHRYATALLLALLFPVALTEARGGEELLEQGQRGRALYMQHCALCHQATGHGTPKVFPPLGGSDFLQDQDRTILAVVQGLSGSIVVNGETYNGVMPPTVLNDDQVADVLTYVYNSWGNDGSVIRPDMVSRVRGRSRFQTFEALERANTYPPLPQAPEGFTVRELVRLPFNPLRLAGDGTGEFLYVLTQHGDLFRVGISNGEIKPLLKAADYLDVQRGEIAAYGMALDDQKRLFISVNQRYDGGPLATNEVTIYRTTAVQDGAPLEARRWFATTYPWGVGYFNHGIGHMAFGPDGLLYVGSGSRTDANETGNNPRYSREGETPLTAGLWRLNPKADVPEVEVYARGLRNIFGFCWNDRGELFAVDNGPDADAPEEMNLIEQGRHYGFPYRFSDWTNKPYPHTPDAPEGLNFTALRSPTTC
jgi:mono/diheme cytochrome c family protein